MTTKPYAISCKAVVCDRQGRCLLLRRSAASKHNAGKWDFPGGKADPGEDLGEALLREIREESGLDVELVRVAEAAESDLPALRVAYLVFEARSESTEVTLSAEHDAFEWVERTRLPQMDVCPQFLALVCRLATPADRGKSVELLIMRHGRTEADDPKVYAGAGDPLTPEGRRQARLAAEWLAADGGCRPERIVSSTLPRALETANIVADRLGMTVTEEPDLRERENGELAGLTPEQAEAKGFLHEYLPHETVPGGETRIALRARAEAVWSKVLSECKAGERVLLVSHGQMIGMLFRAFLRLPNDGSARLRTGDTGIHCWCVAGDKRTILFSNRLAHVETAAPCDGDAKPLHTPSQGR